MGNGVEWVRGKTYTDEVMVTNVVSVSVVVAAVGSGGHGSHV